MTVVRKGPEWGPRNCGASSSYKAWFKHRHEWAGLTFGDPRLGANEEPDLGSNESHRSFKRKLESNPNKEISKKTRLEKESWTKAVAQEKYLREIEQDQALAEKEELRVAMADSRSREAEARD
ncbi:hypothetical protein CR513_23820, partial [Mucuna pruriens]